MTAKKAAPLARKAPRHDVPMFPTANNPHSIADIYDAEETLLAAVDVFIMDHMRFGVSPEADCSTEARHLTKVADARRILRTAVLKVSRGIYPEPR